MRSTFRRVVVAICLALGVTAPGAATEGDNPQSSYVLDFGTIVPLQLQGGVPATVRRVLLNVGGRVQAADPKAGVERQDQNRLDWSHVPLIGGLAEDRYNQADFAPDKVIGEAYWADATLWLDLSDEPAGHTYSRLAVLNQVYAYRLTAAPTSAPYTALPAGPPGRLVGQVFRGANGGLVVLVRPFVVTDSLF